MKKEKIFSSILIMLLLLLVAPSTYAITIDTFDDNQLSGAAVSTVAVGGTRSIRDVLGGGAGAITTVVQGGLLTHSQGSSVTGKSWVTWDSDLVVDGRVPSLPAGLAGLDLKQDNADSFRLVINSFDFPFNKPAALTLAVYDASAPLGDKYSIATVTLNAALSNFVLDIPFSNFIPGADSIGSVDFTRVGAIALIIDGFNPAIDLEISHFSTNGECDILPVNGNAKKDQCGVCGGDNSSCADCSGVPNGISKLDRCGVCNGDSLSCLGCTSLNLRSIQAQMDHTAKLQERVIKDMIRQIKTKDKTPATSNKLKSVAKKTHDLQVRNWVLSWIPKSDVDVCSNKQFCTEESIADILTEYKQHSAELRQIGIDLIAKLQKLKINTKKLSKKNESLYNKSLSEAAKMPVTRSLCS
jgi:hypothetical protein